MKGGAADRCLHVMPTTVPWQISTEYSSPSTYASMRTSCGTGRPRSFTRCASRSAACRSASTRDPHHRTPMLPLPHIGFTIR